MSDDNRGLERTLMVTDDAMIWAQEFVRIFNGHMILMESEVSTAQGNVDEGTMVGWFANAMQAALNVKERRDQAKRDLIEATAGVPGTARDGFVAGFEEGREPAQEE